MQKNNNSNNGFIEKRKYSRIALKVKFQCESHPTITPQEDGLLHFYSKNLCCGGVFVECCSELTEGTILLMEFKLPKKEKTITVKGLVLRTNDKGFGIRFLTLNIDDFEFLDDYVNQCLS